jgi:integrase
LKRSLTDAKVKNIKPKDKAFKVSDGGGLYVFVSKSGTKSFRYDASVNKKRFTVTIGTYPSTSLLDARNKHDEDRLLIKKGIDPRNSLPESKPFSYYAAEQMKTLKLQEGTYVKRLGRMRMYLFPALDKTPVKDITTLELLSLIKPIAESGKYDTAKRLSSYCSQTFDYMLTLQIITSNPAEGLKRLLPKGEESSNFAHITNLDDIRMFLRAMESQKGDYAVKMALQFQTLVFLRPYNVRFLKWEHIDLDKKLITIPAEDMKMKRSHKVPLSTQALAILKNMYRLTGSCKYVFLTSISMNKDKKPMTENTLNVAITRLVDPRTNKMFGRGFLTSHGIRHTASTQLNELGFNSDAIELQLAHASKDRIRGVYNKAELLPQRTDMMQSWADYLDELKYEN